MKKILYLSIYVFAYANTTLNIYVNTSILEESKISNLNESLFQVPANIKQQDILINSKCNILETNFLNYNLKTNKINNEITNLTLKLKSLQDSYQIIQQAKINTNNIKNDNSNIQEILYENLKNQKIITDKLSVLNFYKPTTSYEKTFSIKTDCENEKISISYPINNLNLQTQNQFFANSNNKITINQNIILSNLSQDLKNIKINFFPQSTNIYKKPYTFYPDYLDKYSYEQSYKAENKPVSANMITKSLTSISETNNLLSNFWEIKNINLKANEENLIKINSQNIQANFDNYIDGFGTNKAYLRAKFTPNFNIQAAKSMLFFENSFINEQFLEQNLKDKEVSLFFGLNNFIDVKKELLDVLSEESIFSKNVTTKKIWKYTIKNNSDTNQKITFIEKIPVSTHEDIKVKMIGDLKVKANHEGKVTYNFSLKPKEEISFNFGHEITK